MRHKLEGGTFFQEITWANGKRRVVGQIDLGGPYAKINLTEQSNTSEYLWRGSTALFGADGKPYIYSGVALKAKNSRRKSEPTGKSIPVSCNLFIGPDEASGPIAKGQTYITEAMERYIVEKAQKLAADNANVYSNSSPTIDINHDPLSKLVQKYGQSFLDTKDLSDDTKKKQIHQLSKAASRFCGKPLSQLSAIDILKVQKSDLALDDRELALLLNLWNYGAGKCTLPPNPFVDYKRLYKKKKTQNGETVAKKRGTQVFLSSEQEKELNRRIADSAVTDLGCFAVAMVKDYGLTAAQLCMLRYADVILGDDPLFVQVKIKSNNMGPIQDYTRPGFPFGAMALREAYSSLGKQVSAEKLKSRPLITKDGKNPMSQRELTDLIRTTLKHLGIERQVFAKLKDGNKTEAAGAMFLQNTYRHKVEFECGFPENSPEIRFLFGEAAVDVTSGYYRSFTSPENQRMLYISMRRYGSGLEIPSWNVLSKLEKREGAYVETITPKDSSKKTEVGRTFVFMPGEEITACAQFGIEGLISVREMGVPAEGVEEVPYYRLQKPSENIII